LTDENLSTFRSVIIPLSSGSWTATWRWRHYEPSNRCENLRFPLSLPCWLLQLSCDLYKII